MTPSPPEPLPPRQAWSPHWRSLHPLCTDDEILDALKDYLERTQAKKLDGKKIASLLIFRQRQPCFRLPDGRVCHWGQVPKVASLSIEAALCEHLPYLWRGPHKNWHKLTKQNSHQECHLALDTGESFGKLSLRRARKPAITLALDEGSDDPQWGLFIVNMQNPARKPDGFHALFMETFRPRKHADIRFCMVREPVERFASICAYLWKIMLKEKGMSVQESVDWALKQLAIGLIGRPKRLNPHLKWQSWYIGHDPSYYTHIFQWGEWERLSHFLSDWTGATVQVPHHNRSADDKRPELTPSQKRRAEAFYARDYASWGKYF